MSEKEEGPASNLNSSITEHLSRSLHLVADPRQEGKAWHKLIDILVISVCALICGAESFVEFEKFGEAKEQWLRGFLELPNGIPSHDTFLRVFSLLNIEQAENSFVEWAKANQKVGSRVSFDGKNIRGTSRSFAGARPVCEVNIYDNENRVALGQFYSQSTGNAEVQPVLVGLDQINLKARTVVSFDAALASISIAEKIRERGGHYLFPIKNNRGPSVRELEQIFLKIPEKTVFSRNKMNKKQKKMADFAKTAEWNHGRYEERGCTVIAASKCSEKFRQYWPDVQSVVRMRRYRKQKRTNYNNQVRLEDGTIQYLRNTQTEKIEDKITFYVSSKKGTAKSFLRLIREHWAVENNLHWILDVAFHEDAWRVKNKTAAHSLAMMRKFAFNLLQVEPTEESVKVKMKRAAWNQEYLNHILFDNKSLPTESEQDVHFEYGETLSSIKK